MALNLTPCGMHKLLISCPLQSHNHCAVRYAMKMVDGVAICADFYGTDHECRMLPGMKRRLEVVAKRYETKLTLK